jgi:predicted nucleic acid-binding Zn ribbon protein
VSTDPAPSAPPGAVCPLCGEPISSDAIRCPACGMTLEGVGNRPDPFPRRILWLWAGALLAVYLVVLLMVATVPD